MPRTGLGLVLVQTLLDMKAFQVKVPAGTVQAVLRGFHNPDLIRQEMTIRPGKRLRQKVTNSTLVVCRMVGEDCTRKGQRTSKGLKN